MLEQKLEADLLARVAEGDSEAFSRFYDQTSAVLFGIADSIVRDPALAEDILQEVYVSIWEKADRYSPALGKPISWAIALTRNRALDKLRSRTRSEAGTRRLESFEAGSPLHDASSSLEQREVAGAVLGAMNKLDVNKRQAIELAFIKGLPHAEVADQMQQPLGTIKAWIRRGMIELREELSDIFKQ